MAIKEHPVPGTIVLCDFGDPKKGGSFRPPEMIKRRPVVVVSPKIARRSGLCTVVCLSTTAPDPVLPFHRAITIDPPLPAPRERGVNWIKGDMVYAVGSNCTTTPN